MPPLPIEAAVSSPAGAAGPQVARLDDGSLLAAQRGGAVSDAGAAVEICFSNGLRFSRASHIPAKKQSKRAGRGRRRAALRAATPVVEARVPEKRWQNLQKKRKSWLISGCRHPPDRK